MATAIKLRSDIKKYEAAIKSKATPSKFKEKLKAQLDKAKSDLSALKSPKSAKSTPPKKKKPLSTLEKLEAKVKKTPSLARYKNSGVDLVKDADQPALKTGRRVSKGIKGNQFADKKSAKGNVYYEYRVNRLDIKQPPKRYPKLEDGGMMAKGGYVSKGELVWGKLSSSKKMEFLHENFTPQITPRSQEILVGKDFQFLPKDVKIKLESKYADVEDYEDGGMMADGGLVDPKELPYSLRKRVENIKGKYPLNKAKIIELYDYSESRDGIGASTAASELFGGNLSKRDQLTLGDLVLDLGRYYKNQKKKADGGMMAKGVKTNLLKEDDFVWNAVGKKLVVDEVTNDEYYLSGFLQPSASPFSKKKVDEYIRSGQWSLKPKMAEGGMMAKGGETHRAEDPEVEIDEDEMKVVRGYSDDEPYEYAKGGEIRYKLKGNNFGQQIENGAKFKALISKAFENQSGEHKHLENFIKEIAYTGKIVKNEGSNYLKDYSYKGTLTKFEFLDDKDFVEALKYVDRPSIKTFKF